MSKTITDLTEMNAEEVAKTLGMDPATALEKVRGDILALEAKHGVKTAEMIRKYPADAPNNPEWVEDWRDLIAIERDLRDG